MQLTRGGDYGIRGVLYLAQQPAGQLIPLEAIAEAADLPTPFLAKVLQTLTRADIVAGRRGAGGGFCLAKPAREITLLAIIEAIEGPLALNRCLRGPGACAQQPICPVYVVWRHAQARLVEVLQSTNMQNLAQAARALRRRDTTMPKELITLESPIDAMFLLHKAFRAEAGRVQKLVDQLQEGDSLQPFQAAFSRWATLLGYHAAMEDTCMTALLPIRSWPGIMRRCTEAWRRCWKTP